MSSADRSSTVDSRQVNRQSILSTVGYTPDRNDDPVCVVGLGCHLPGSIRSPSNLWDFLVDNRSAQSRVPESRFNIEGFYHRDENRAGAMNADGGYFLDDDVRLFENDFFGINNLEAAYMDPQQRKLLEVVFECLDHAGESLESVSGTNTGVYVGRFTVDHQTMQSRDPDTIHRYSATGGGTTILANRISHVFNLHGPSFTLDTACSSSIYCLDSAVSALKTGACDTALVAAVNLITAPEQCLATGKAGVLSPRSTCRTFDASADGYGRADGVSAIYLKRLSSAIKDGNKIWAVVRSTAVNSNGRTIGITQPSVDLQETVIRKAYGTAGLNFNDTDYMECHGTGTPVGDPIEIDAIRRCFSESRETPLLFGAVKPNLGHSEASSGLTSLIKVALSFNHGKIPPTRRPDKLNPALRLDSSNLKLVTELEEWPRAVRRASINSFGYGGANAHAILEAFDSYTMTARPYTALTNGDSHDVTPVPEIRLKTGDAYLVTPPGTPEPHIVLPHDLSSGLSKGLSNDLSDPVSTPSENLFLVISAGTSKSLAARIQQIGDIASNLKQAQLESLASTLNSRKHHHTARQALITQSSEEGGFKLIPIDAGSAASPLPLAFVFTGQGAQYPGMAKELLKNQHFLAIIRGLDDTLQSLPSDKAPSWSIEQYLSEPEAAGQERNSAVTSQTLCTAIQIGIVDLLQRWGAKPTAVIGHSSGEIAAAFAAGLIDRKQAIFAAYLRGCAVEQVNQEGSMMAVALDVDAAQSIIREAYLDREVCVACVNSPESVTLSGTPDGIRLLEKRIREMKKQCSVIRSNGRAYHSYMMREVGAEYESMLRSVFVQNAADAPPGCSTATMWSTVASAGAEMSPLTRNIDWPVYWRKNLEETVQFDGALRRLASSTALHYLEIGPHHALKGPIRQIRAGLNLGDDRFRYSPTLALNRDADLCIKQLAGTLFTHGHNLDWTKVNASGAKDTPFFGSLPPYPWDYSSTKLLYYESRSSYELRNKQVVRHELLGSRRHSGNGIDCAWRNEKLRLEEVPWMRDHTVGSQVVFPAAAYLSMIIEGLGQIRDDGKASPSSSAAFEFRNVSFKAVLVVNEDDALSGNDIELHTTLTPRKISNTSTSASWYEFGISSWIGGKVTSHCVGSIREVSAVAADNDPVAVYDSKELVTVSTDPWYAKFALEGLDFGPDFHSVSSLKINGSKEEYSAIGKARVRHLPVQSVRESCALHPVTIDACLQTGIMTTCAGKFNELQAYLPVFMKECRVGSIAVTDVSHDSYADIHARSERTGVSTQRIHCSLRDADGYTLVEMSDVRMSLHSEKLPDEEINAGGLNQRHPCLRVQWKPDAHHLRPGSAHELQKYIAAFLEDQNPDVLDDKEVGVIGALLDLAGHKNPRLRVLEVGEGGSDRSKKWLSLLDKDGAFARCQSWHTDAITADSSELVVKDDGRGLFDTIIIPTLDGDEKYWKDPSIILSHLASDGTIIAHNTSAARASLELANFWVIEVDERTLLARRSSPKRQLALPVYLVVRQLNTSVSDFALGLSALLQTSFPGAKVEIVSIDNLPDASVFDRAVCISLLELESTYLATMEQLELDALRRITNGVSTLLWVTGAGMLKGGDKANPDLTLSAGLSRALMLEQPALRFAVVDVGTEALERSSIHHTTGLNIIDLLLSENADRDDHEYIQRDGILHVSRFTPERQGNALFERRLRTGHATNETTLSEARPARLTIGKVGVTETIHFQQLCEPTTPPPAGFVDIEIQVVSLNAKDVYALNGRVETRMGATAMEFGGIVSSIGADVPETQLKPGDRVVAILPNHFTTTVRAPAWAVHRVRDDEDLCLVSGMLVAYCTALYAFNDRAHLRRGESVLIHSGAGALGIAAIMIAQRACAVVYATVGSQAKKEWIVNQLGVPESHIFDSHDAASFVKGVRDATGGRGVDVILNSLTGDLMHSSWECIAPFGRFIEVGKRELIDAGKLDMSVFLRSVTFTAFDLSEMFYSDDKFYHELLHGKVEEVLSLLRSKEIEPLPTKTFDVSETANAYRYFSKRDRIGKIVISFEKPDSIVPVSPAPYLTLLSPHKVYLLVGCLGGLGRSLSRWLLSRGAKNFVFLGRSGCDRPAAQDLVARLQETGANVSVVRGDVCDAEDVKRAVKTCADTGMPLGGVVQASMGLSESIFSTMTSKAWQTAIKPKWAGTWNLESAVREQDQLGKLDFFLLMSSVSGTVGTATESNYCAANGFLDSFAQALGARGLPVVSLGLGMVSEVGYLHENSEIEALLLRRGIQPLNEAEFLQVVDLTLLSAKREYKYCSSLSQLSSPSHILTGLESLRIRELRNQGFDVSHGAARDPRASILAAASEAQFERPDESHELSSALATASWMKDIPPRRLTALKQEADAPSLSAAVLKLTKKSFSTIILLSADQIDENKRLMDYGVDSMIASEFRTWFWTAFGVEVPFLDILGQGKSLIALSDFVTDQLVSSA
ncbi:polyketide synthase [Xylaria intraflava]|nr:polyketide synthase [Xylaria intraflava]